MSTPADDTPLARHPAATAARVGEETVILHGESGFYFGLDPVATRIWELLETPTTPALLRARIAAEFDVSPAALAQDIASFLGAMLDQELLRQAAEESSG